ncbi:MAG TPA: glycoside hydrolase family 9 protein [Tepidisphaeraceae bacterium]|jgi:hypothetical protein|nr:glycoside hydrolase family 9 protein [Tepidisphaeraceae bacterium]
MSPTRRRLLQQGLGLATLALAGSPAYAGVDDRRRKLLLNHVGFTPIGAKHVLMTGGAAVPFTVRRSELRDVVHNGEMIPFKGDHGDYVVGDFSAIAQQGTYEIEAGGVTSGAFDVRPDVYQDAINKSIAYFAVQRCGDSRSGYNQPCHLDDGRRSDNGKRQDVSGGWHDACDVRKWVTATIYGMTGLSRVLDTLGPKVVDRAAIVDELLWGNQYFRKMQEPGGYVMNYCGGDDGNNFTDNLQGSADDRVIHVEPCEVPAQFHFIAAQAAMVRHLREADIAYARAAEASAMRCLDWCVERRTPRTAVSLAAGVIACVELHRAINIGGGDRSARARLKTLAAGYTRQLLALQVNDAAAPVRGFFRHHPDEPEPSREIMHGNLPLLAICEAIGEFADHRDAALWRGALERHIEYLQTMSGRSAFGTIPFGLYSGSDPGGDRRLGAYWYRWFMQDHDERNPASDWWVGINAHLASNGVGLCRAGRLMREPRLIALAQRQLDWIIGTNPFGASTISGVGRSQPELFVTSEFKPVTPNIPGGVMNGLAGSKRDEVVLESGSYNTSEYWTPMVAYTMWLMAELATAKS